MHIESIDWILMEAWEDPKGGDRGSGPYKLQYFFLDILVRTPHEKLSDPSGPIASQRRSVQTSVKYVDGKKSCHDPPPLLPCRNVLDLPIENKSCMKMGRNLFKIRN